VMNVVKQDNVGSEHIAKQSGLSKNVHVVVKNLGFHVEIQSNISLNECHLDAKLLYDFDTVTDNKMEVSYIKNEPMEYKVHLLDSGEKADIEVKIKVLTSQHEDMLFRVRFVAIDPITKIPFECYTQPIKVISKLTQLKKATITMSPSNATPKRKSSNNSNMITSSPPQPSSDLNLLGTLLRFEDKQNAIQSTLDLIIAKLNGETTMGVQSLHALSLASNLLQPDNKNDLRSSQEGIRLSADLLGEDKRDLESAFRAFFIAFNEYPGERRDKFQQLVDTLTTQDMERLYEFIKMFESTFPHKKKTKN